MTPGARVQAAVELLDEIIVAARDGGAAADTLIARYFKTRRYAGSKDRRAVRDLVYRAIRRSGDRPHNGRHAMIGLAREDAELKALFDGKTPHGPPAMEPKEKGASASPLPKWLAEKLAGSLTAPEQEALLGRAPLDLRVNRRLTDRDAVLAMLPDAVPSAHAPFGIRLPEGAAVETSEAWNRGFVEIQDEGSQLIALAAKARPGMIVLDLCAGAGGKTLAMADDMEGEGQLIATDTDRGRLSRLSPRAARAGLTAVETRLLDPDKEMRTLHDLQGLCDVVLIDAPCSGTGTWRRNPEARWRLSPDRLTRLTALQGRLLDMAATLVKPGGALVYAVCSVLDDEGAKQVADFLGRTPAFRPEKNLFTTGRHRGPGTLLSPLADGTDGFFVARLIATC